MSKDEFLEVSQGGEREDRGQGGEGISFEVEGVDAGREMDGGGDGGDIIE